MKKIWILLCISIIIISARASAQTYYVDTGTGRDTNGGSKTSPFATIQKAADIAQAGDTVIVMPGVYYETVRIYNTGTKEKPIVFRAAENEKDKVIITQADRNIREGKAKWTLENENLRLYSIPFEKDPTRVLADRVDLQGYYSLYRLENYCGRVGEIDTDGYIAGSKNGFYYDSSAKKLYVRLHPNEALYGSSDPNERMMCVAEGGAFKNMNLFNGKTGNAINMGKENSLISVLSETDAYVVIYGFTFETPTWNGVFLRANHVTVSDCWFVGCQCGVAGGAINFYDNTYITTDITVQYCHHDLFPSYEEAMEIMKERYEATLEGKPYGYEYQFWQKKAHGSTETCRSTYGGDETGGFVGHMGQRWTLRNNYIGNILDGMSFFATSPYSVWVDGYSTTFDIISDITMYENHFEYCLDNAMELEDSLNGLDMYHNEFVNTFEPISWQPLGGWPLPKNIKIHHNLFYTTDDFTDLWYNYTNKKYQISAFKMGTPRAAWKEKPWLMAQPFDYVNDKAMYGPHSDEYGLRIFNNTVILGENSDFISECASTGSIDQKPNFIFANNIVMTGTKTNRAAPAGNICLEDRGYDFIHNIFINCNNEQITTDPNYGFAANGGIIMNAPPEEFFVDPENQNFSLKEGSPAIGAGYEIAGEYNTKDAGAIPCGESWHIDYSPKKYGDVNCDGVVSIADIIEIARLVGMNEADEYYNCRADMNFDGTIDQNDIQIAYAIESEE